MNHDQDQGDDDDGDGQVDSDQGDDNNDAIDFSTCSFTRPAKLTWRKHNGEFTMEKR